LNCEPLQVAAGKVTLQLLCNVWFVGYGNKNMILAAMTLSLGVAVLHMLCESVASFYFQ
jgi:hypothetical protein